MSSIQLPTLPSMSAVDTVPLRPAAGCSERTNRMYSIKKKKSFGFWDLLCLDPRAETQGEVLNIKGLRKTRGRRVSCGWDEGRGGAISLWGGFFWKGEGDTGGRRWSWLLSRASMFLKNTHVLKYHVDYFGAINAKDRVENDWSGLSRTSTF